MRGASTAASIRVLVISSNPSEAVGLDTQLTGDPDPVVVETVPDVDAARAVLGDHHVDCVVCRHDPPALDGVAVLSALRRDAPDLPILFATEAADAADVIDGGPTDIIQLTGGELHPDIVRNRIQSIVEKARERDKYEQIFQRANDGIIVHDPETGELLDANRRLYEMLGYDPETVSDLSLADIVAGADEYTESAAREMVRTAAAEGPRTFQWLDEAADGSVFWVEVSLEPATIAGERCVLAFVRDITERKETEAVLRDRERQFEAVFDHPSTVATVVDAEGCVVRANESALDLIAADRTAVEGIPLWETPWWADDERAAQIREAVERATAGDASQVETVIDAVDGRRTIEMQFNPLASDDDSDVQSVVAVGHDITERKATERKLTTHRERLRRLHEITADPGRSLEDQIRALLELGCDQLGLEVGYLARIDRGTDTLEVAQTHGPADVISPGDQCALGETYCRLVVDTDEDGLVAIDDVGEAGMDDDPAYQRHGLDAYIGAEIVINGNLYGTLCFADREPRDSAFSEPQRAFVEFIAQWLRREFEYREYQQELERARDRFERTLDRVADAFFALDDEWRVTYVNDAGAQVLQGAMADGVPRDELLGRHLWESVPEAVDTPFHEQCRRAMDEQEPVRFEEYYEPLDRWFAVSAYPDEAGLSVHFQDVTNRKTRERQLGELLDASQQFHRASDVDALVDALIDAVDEVFEYHISGVRLHDAETNTLPPTRVSAAAIDRVPDPPVYDDTEGLAGRAFQSGDPFVVDNLASDVDHDYGPVTSAMVLPLGDHGTLSVGATERDAFDDEDAALVELLTTAATEALDRLDREQEMRQLQRVIDQVGEMAFLLDGQGEFEFVSRQFASFVGLNREHLDGVRLTDLFATDDGDRSILDATRTDDAGGGSHTVEATVRTGDGEGRPVEITLSAMRDGAGTQIAGTVADISELAETRSDLAWERDRFRVLFETLPDPVVEVRFDADDRPIVRYTNPAFTDVFGHDRETLRGENINEFVVPSDARETAEELDTRVRRNEVTNVEVQREAHDGMRDFLLRTVTYDRGPHTYGFAVYTDLTRQKERERYLQVLNRVLRHNLRNDLNVVLGLAQELVANVTDDELEAYATMLRDNAADVVELSEKAKEIERVVGRRAEELAAVDAVSHLRAVVEQFRESHPDAAFRMDTPPELYVRADSDLRRAVEELVENALEHNDSETPQVTVAADPTVDADGRIELRIRDDGPGIPDEEWDLVTDEEDITQMRHGSGLGLWLCRWIVRSYGGDIRRTETESGTEIVIRLRRATPDAVPVRAEEEAEVQ